MEWFLGIALAGVVTVAIILHLRNRRRWSRIGEVVKKVAAGERTSLADSLADPLFGRVFSMLQEVAEERDRLKQQINEDSFNLGAILSSMTEGVMVVDAERRIQLVNDSFLQLFSLERSPVGKTVLMSLREAAIEEVLRTTIETSEPQSNEISLPAQSEAATRYFQVNSVPVKDRHGRTSGAVTVLHEITQLRQVEAIRREFVSNVSHELRTPLSIFRGYLENLMDNPEVSRRELADSLAVMRKHSDRLNALLEDLLTLARLESRRINLEPVSIRVVPFLKQMVEDWRMRLGAKEIRIRYEGEEALPPISADMLRMEQVFTNLIDNAMKYTPEGGEIVVSARRTGGGVEIAVQDNGIGIPPPDLPHVFERFFRVDKARSREAGGTGLGLSIVKHIVAMHDGTVRAESAYGKWTKITLGFPVEEEDDAWDDVAE
jgi:two-component system phosphate regulon sensor histidine kinase PhoR